MTPTLLLSLLCGGGGVAHAVEGAEHSTAGVQLSAFALQTPARHAIVPSLGVWASYTPRPWALTGELTLTRRAKSNDYYGINTQLVRASALAELAMGTRPMTVHIGAGPALTVSSARAEWGETDAERITRADLGVRARVALDGPLGERLAWQWQVGVASRGVYNWDYDLGAGLGVQW